MEELSLDMHGISVALRGLTPGLRESLRFDLSEFVTEWRAEPMLTITYQQHDRPAELVPAAACAINVKGARSSSSGGVRWVRYEDGSAVSFDYAKEEGVVFARHPEQAHTHIYYLILSRVGERLDLRGCHRVHAFGAEAHGRAYLLLAAQGVGKSTLGLNLLRHAGMRLISDDTPILDRDGMVRPFAVRASIKEARAPHGIEPGEVRSAVAEDGTPRTLIDPRALDAIDRDARLPLGALVLLERCADIETPSIHTAGRLRAFAALMTGCVVGLGVPQMIQYFVRGTMSDAVSKTRIARSRFAVALRTAQSARCVVLRACILDERAVTLLTDYLDITRGADGTCASPRTSQCPSPAAQQRIVQ